MSADTKPEVNSLDQRIKEVIEEDPSKFLSRYKSVINEAIDATKKRKLMVTVEGPMGCGKTTLAQILAENLNLACFVEKPELLHISRYLQMLYHNNSEVKKVGALGVNVAYLAHRMEQFSEAMMLAGSCILDRTPHADNIYMEGFVEDKLMTQEQVDWITNARLNEMNLLMPKGITAPLQMIIQLVGKSETFYKRKNRRGRKEETESNGSGVPLAYIASLTERYKKLPDLVHKAGFRGPIFQITQELEDNTEFESSNNRHLIPIYESIRDYVNANGFNYR